MKIVLFSLLSCAILSCSSPRTRENIVSFNDVFIDESIENFSSQLKEKGFVDSGYENCLLGTYLEEEAALFIVEDEQSHKIRSVVIAINCPPHYTLHNFKLKIGALLNEYTDKYGARTDESMHDKTPGTLALWGGYIYSWEIENQYILIKAVYDHPEKGNLIEIHLSNIAEASKE